LGLRVVLGVELDGLCGGLVGQQARWSAMSIPEETPADVMMRP
jgi:hypothetical protein